MLSMSVLIILTKSTLLKIGLVVNSSVRDFKNAPFLILDDIDAIKTVTICSGTGANDEIGVLDFDSWQFEEELKLEHRNGINRIRRKVPPVCYVVTVDGWNANRDFRPKRGIRTTRVQGYTRPLEFYSPAYRDGALPPGTDRRRTLYWNPSVKTDKNGCAVIECYNSDRTSPLTISVETICGGMPGAVVKHSVD